MGNLEDRHLAWPNLLTYLEEGAPVAISIGGSPDVRLIVEPVEDRIAIRGPWPAIDEVPELTMYRHLDVRVGTDPAGDWVELGASGRDVLRGAYSILTAVADMVQLDGLDMGVAIRQAIASHRELLSALGRLSDHQEVGLFGELLILNHLIDSVGEQTAVTSWKGPTWEEHDFGFDTLDLEVKTTLTEDRSHRISSLTQLEPSPHRALWLVSVQLTTTGVGGRSLPELIAQTSHRLEDLVIKTRYIEKLTRLGWHLDQSHLYTRRFTTRGQTWTFKIDDSFPALTRQALAAAGLPVERFSNVSYILHTAGLTPDTPPTILEEG